MYTTQRHSLVQQYKMVVGPEIEVYRFDSNSEPERARDPHSVVGIP